MADSSHIMESWAGIPQAPHYLVSNLGRVMRGYSTSNGRVGKIMRPWMSDGYWFVTLHDVSGAPKRFQVHRLVCAAFHGDPPTRDHQCAHWNGIRTDNRAENLRWATPRENSLDRERHGTTGKGKGSCQSKLTEEDVHEIRATPKKYGTVAMLARVYGVSDSTITYVMNGRYYSDLPWREGSQPQHTKGRR